MTSRLMIALLLAALAACHQPRSRDDGSHVAAAATSPSVMVLGALDERASREQVLRKLQTIVQPPAGLNRLAQVIDFLHEQTGLNFMVNWAALEAAQVKADLPSPMELTEGTAESVLNQAMRQSSNQSLEPMGFEIAHGVVYLSTLRDLWRLTLTRMYVVKPSLIQPRAVEPYLIRRATFFNNLGHTVRGAPSISEESMPDKDSSKFDTFEIAMDELTTLIQDTVGNQSDWAAYGGNVGFIRHLNGVLIVKTLPKNHGDIERLLGQLFHGDPDAWLATMEAEHLLRKAQALRLNGHYQEARRLIDLAVGLTPDDPRVLAMRTVVASALGQPAPIPVTRDPTDRTPWTEPSQPVVGPPSPADFEWRTAIKAMVDGDADLVALEAKLDRRISVRHQGRTLAEVLAELAAAADAPLTIDWPALKTKGVGPDEPITLVCADLPARFVLDSVIRQASRELRDDDVLDHAARPPQSASAAADIHISLRSVINNISETRVYNIRDFQTWGTTDDSIHLLHGRSDLSSVKSMRFERCDEAGIIPIFLDELYESMISLIQEVVSDNTGWAAYGGDVASIRELNGNLIIRCPLHWHRQVERLLADLRLVRMWSTVNLMRHREVLQLMHQADALRMEQKYEQALKLTEQALRVDPGHRLARNMKRVIERTQARRAGQGVD